MIPLIYFVIAWLIFLGIFFLLSALSIFQMLRHGLAHPLTQISTAAFIILSVVIILGTLGYLTGVDLNSGLDLNSFLRLDQSIL